MNKLNLLPKPSSEAENKGNYGNKVICHSIIECFRASPMFPFGSTFLRSGNLKSLDIAFGYHCSHSSLSDLLVPGCAIKEGSL